MAGESTKAVPTVAERLAVAAKDRIADRANLRKTYRLRVVSTKDQPAPFEAVTIGGHSFSERTYRHVEDSRGRLAREERGGTFEQLTEGEIAKLRAEIEQYIVRWRNRDGLLGSAIDGRMLTSFDPDTDEPIGPYVSIEEVK